MLVWVGVYVYVFYLHLLRTTVAIDAGRWICRFKLRALYLLTTRFKIMPVRTSMFANKTKTQLNSTVLGNRRHKQASSQRFSKQIFSRFRFQMHSI